MSSPSSDGLLEGGRHIGKPHLANLASIGDSAAIAEAIEQSSFSNKLVKQSPLLDQLLGRIKLGHSSLLQHYDAVRVQYRVDPMSDRDYCAVLEYSASERCLQHLIGLHIYGRSGLI